MQRQQLEDGAWAVRKSFLLPLPEQEPKMNSLPTLTSAVTADIKLSGSRARLFDPT